MAQLVVLYKTPKDAAAFDKHYADIHIPLTKKIAGLQKFELSHGPIASPTGPSGIHQVAILHFKDVPAILSAFGSPEGQAAAADAQAIGTPDDLLLIFDTHEV